MKYDQEIVDYLREYWNLPSSISDEELYEGAKDSLIYARINIHLRFKELKEDVTHLLGL